MANSLEILITGKDQFSPKAQQAQRSAKGLKGGMAGLGKTVVGVGAGFIAAQASIAGVSKLFSSTIGSALKFEHQLAQIRGLTGATKKDTDLLSGAIKDMARTMPKSPAELGAGAYFIISAGITDAAEAANVLEISAKASAAGLGETRVVADAVTSTLNAYKLEASDAARVTDILTTTVRLGKTEAAALAGSIGRILPVAAAMGVSFEEVGANLAVMTKVGLSADEAATSLRAVMTQLLRPTTEASDALAALGLSGETLRKQIREKGLLSALSTLMEKTGGNTEQITKIIPNVRALTNVLGTVGSQAETYADTLDQMNNAQGATEKAFAEVADTAQFKMQVALSDLNVTLMELGAQVLPVVVPMMKAVVAVLQDMAGAVGVVLDPIEALKTGFQGLNQPLLGLLRDTGLTRENFVGIGQDALMSSEQIAEMGRSIGLTSKEIREALREAGEVGAVIDAAGEVDRFRRRADELAGALAEAEDKAAGLDSVSADLEATIADLTAESMDARDALLDLFKDPTLQELNATAALKTLQLEEARLIDTAGPLTDAIKKQAKEMAQETGDAEALELQIRGLTSAETDRLSLLQNELIPEQQDHIDVLRLQRDELGAVTEANVMTARSQDDLVLAVMRGTETFNAAEIAEEAATTELANYQRIVQFSIGDQNRLTASLRAGETAVDPWVKSLQASRRELLKGTETADSWITKLRSVPKRVSTIWDISIEPSVTVQGFTITAQQAELFRGAQHGFHGTVTGPQGFFIEPGKTERVDITPSGGGGGGGGGVTVNLNLYDAVLVGEDAGEQLAEIVLPHIRRAVA